MQHVPPDPCEMGRTTGRRGAPGRACGYYRLGELGRPVPCHAPLCLSLVSALRLWETSFAYFIYIFRRAISMLKYGNKLLYILIEPLSSIKLSSGR